MYLGKKVSLVRELDLGFIQRKMIVILVRVEVLRGLGRMNRGIMDIYNYGYI